ncbi:MAG: hypothetical protein ACTSX7_18460 [Alphaproteobacteria bacterium]
MTSQYVAGVFRDVPAFKKAFDALIEAGFSPQAVSVLAASQSLKDQFGEDAPVSGDPTENDHGAVKTAIHLFAESLATIGMIGAAGVAYAVGGPIGFAATASDSTERSVENLLADHVDESHHKPYEDAIQNGGVACWVSAATLVEEKRASELLTVHQAEHVHVVAKS